MLIIANTRVNNPITLIISKQLKQVIILNFFSPVEIKISSNNFQIKCIRVVHERFKHVEIGEVIGLKNRNILAVSHIEASIYSNSISAIFFVNNDKARVGIGKLVQNFRRIICRAIVNSNNLNILKRLGKQTLDTGNNENLVIIYRHNN